MRWGMMIVALAMLATPAMACMGVESESYSLLKALPEKAFTHPVVAKVKLVSVDGDEAQVRVIKALKGVRKGATIRIGAYSSCSRLPSASHIGKSYYIVGKMITREDGNVEFSGEWNARKLGDSAPDILDY